MDLADDLRLRLEFTALVVAQRWWQAERERTPIADVSNGHGPTMGLRHPRGDVQSEPGTSIAGGARGRPPPASLE